MIREYYQAQYRELVSGPEPLRFLVFEPLDRTGWGNRLRGLTLGILMAVATRRILVLKDFLLEEHFDPPEGCLWRYGEWKKRLRVTETEVQVMDLHLQPSNWNQTEWEAYRTESMEVLFPARVVYLRESIGFFDQLVANPLYQAVWQACALPVESKIAWLGLVTEAFLDRPRPRLQRHYQKFLRRWSGQLLPNVLVQYRTFYDIGSPNSGAVAKFIEGVLGVLASHAPRSPHVYVATDSVEATRRIGEGLSKHATVSLSQTKVVHTGSLHNGWELLAERGLSRLFHREFHFFDFWFWLPEAWRPRPHTSILAEWMFMGTCEVVFSTFTSFTVYAMARSGNRAKLFRFDTETGALGPLTGDKYFF